MGGRQAEDGVRALPGHRPPTSSAALDARETAIRPERTRHLAFGDVAAAWGMLERLGVVATIDEVVGARRRDAGASVGTYLALAALNRLVDPCSKLGFENWWRTTAADGSPRSVPRVLDHRKFWDAMHAVSPEQLARIEHRLAMGMVEHLRAGHLRAGAGHDQLRHLHRHHQRQGTDRRAGQGQAETRRPAPGRARPGGHPRRWRSHWSRTPTPATGPTSPSSPP